MNLSVAYLKWLRRTDAKKCHQFPQTKLSIKQWKILLPSCRNYPAEAPMFMTNFSLNRVQITTSSYRFKVPFVTKFGYNNTIIMISKKVTI